MNLVADIKAIQRHVGTVPDGIVGPMTVAAIRKALRECKPVEQTPMPLTIEVAESAAVAGEEILDERTLKNIKTLEPRAQDIFTTFMAEAKAIAASMGCEYVAISGNRTFKEQDRLFAQGRTRPGNIVTNARGGHSNHNFGIALDNGVFKGGKYLDGSKSAAERRLAAQVHTAVAAIADKHGLDWGGSWSRFKDLPHFEVSTDLSMAEKRRLVNSGKEILA